MDDKVKDSIEFLEQLEPGNFCTVNMPLFNNESISVTAMFMGKDENGRYNFLDTGRFIFSKEFIIKKGISIKKEFNEEKAFEIYSNFKKLQNKSKDRER